MRAGRPRRRRLLAVSVLAAMLLLASDASLRAGASAAPGSLRDLRVCSYSNFSRALDRCTTNEQATLITSNKLICSVTLVARSVVTVRERWFFDGKLQWAFRPATYDPGTRHIWINYNLRTALPVPGGTWRCDFRVGTATAALTLRSGGPTGQVVDTTVCRGERRIGQTRCIADDSGAPIATSTTILCEGIFVGQSDHRVVIQLVRGDQFIQPGEIDIVRGILWDQYQNFTSPSGKPYPPGDYACLYRIDEDVALTKPFTLTR